MAMETSPYLSELRGLMKTIEASAWRASLRDDSPSAFHFVISHEHSVEVSMNAGKWLLQFWLSADEGDDDSPIREETWDSKMAVIDALENWLSV